jgi:hypothetical protein
MSGLHFPSGALNGIPRTMFHDEGAYAQCNNCGRYTLEPKALGDRPPACDCGSTTGWCGSFKRPGKDAKWAALAAPPSAPTATPGSNKKDVSAFPSRDEGERTLRQSAEQASQGEKHGDLA